jgi:hypothetical protein
MNEMKNNINQQQGGEIVRHHQQPIHLDTYSRIAELEIYIEQLQHQQKIIQNIESYVEDYMLDFADLMETNALLDEEIERYQRQIWNLVNYDMIMNGDC